MSQSLARILLHIIFSTKYRKPLIDDDISDELYAYLGGICKALECPPIKVGGHVDHIHILCRLSKKITIMKLLEEVKKNSSKWIKTKSKKYDNFYWQDGYAVFSVNPKDVDVVANYIANQNEHHQKKSFQDECRIFFKKYQIEYDERYVWD